MIRTIKELKEIIQNLPDDMEVMGYNGGNGDLVCISHWIISEEDLDEDLDVKPTLVISTD